MAKLLLEKIALELSIALWLVFAFTFTAFAGESLPLPAALANTPERWAVYYGEELPSTTFLPYDLVVFDSVKYPPLRPLQNHGKTLLGYLSIGEAEDYREDFKTIKGMGLLLHENKNWAGHFMVDVRKPEWTKYLIEQKIPEILHKHFNGLMLYTADSVLALETTDPVRFRGMKQALLDLLATIRMHYPEIKIMINRGFDAFPEAAPYVDMVMAESTMIDAYSDPKKPKFFEDFIYQEIADKMKAAQAVSPALKVYGLDYWDPKDPATIKKIYAKHRATGYIPYVSTADLQDVIEEPK